MTKMFPSHQIVRIKQGLTFFDRHDGSRHNLLDHLMGRIAAYRDDSSDHIRIRHNPDNLIAATDEQASNIPVAHNLRRLPDIGIAVHGDELFSWNHEGF